MNGCRQDPECARFSACPKRGTDAQQMETDRYARLFRPAMRDEGVLVSQNQFEANFVSYAHTEEDVERTLDAYRDCL